MDAGKESRKRGLSQFAKFTDVEASIPRVKILMKKFCSYPFTRAHIAVSGKVFVCCGAWIGKPIGNIFEDEFRKIWNSESAIDIRKSILDESFRFCKEKRCPRIVSGVVKKEGTMQKYRYNVEKQSPVMERGPEHLSLNYDYTCNLHCKSCRREIRMLDRDSQRKLMEFQDSLLKSKLFKQIESMTVTGAGEALASPVFMDLFRKIRQSDNPALKIKLRTNGILLTPEKWEEIKNVHYAIDSISISIDAADETTYRTLRRGGDFGKLMENLAFVARLKKQRRIKIKFNFVVQKSNYLQMPDFVKLAKKFDCDVVAFSKILDRKTYENGEYHDIAINEPGHPEFENLKTVLMHPVFKEPMVSLGNLSGLLERQSV